MDSQYWKIDQPNCGEQQHLPHPNQSSVLLNCIPVAILLRQVNLLMLNPNSTVYSRVPDCIQIQKRNDEIRKKREKERKIKRNMKYTKQQTLNGNYRYGYNRIRLDRLDMLQSFLHVPSSI